MESLSKIGITDKEVRNYSILRGLGAKMNRKQTFETEASTSINEKLGRKYDPEITLLIPLEVQERFGRGADGGYYRDLTVGTTSAGGYLVGTENVGFVDLLRNRSVLLQMGAQRLPGLQGNVSLPRETGAATAYWLTTEATTATESNISFDQMSLTPKTVAAYVEISRQLLLQSSPGAEGIVTNDLAQQVATAADLAGLNGSGSNGEPRGIMQTSGIGSVTGTTLSYTGIVEFQTDVAAGNVTVKKGGYVTTPAVAGVLMGRQRFTSTDTPLWNGSVYDATMAGFRAMSSAQMPSATMLYGDFSETIFAEWGILAVEINPFAQFTAGIVGVRAMYTIDIGVRRATAYSKATGIT